MEKVKEIIRAVWDFMKKLGVGSFILILIGLVLRLIIPGMIGGRLIEYFIVAGITLAIVRGEDIIIKWWKGFYKKP